MATKQMVFENEARQEIGNGLSQLAKAVKATLGPRGRNVVFQKSFGSPRITKDGVTVSKEIELPSPSRIWGQSSLTRLPAKPATSRATAPPLPLSWPKRSTPKASSMFASV